MDKATVESVMAKAMMLVGALDDSCEAATSLPFLEAVTTLRTEIERLAAQSAPAETSAVVSAPKFTRLKFFRDLSNDERMRMLRVFMDLSTIPDDAIKTHGVQRQLFDRVFAVAQSAQAPAQAVQEARCACNDRPASECPGEWEPGCDLGNNPKYVRAYVDADRASSGATPAAQPTTLQAHTKAVGEWLGELYAVMVDPCADGQMTPQAMCEAIMAAALQARELAAVTPADVRMLTPREIELLREIRLHAQFGLNEGWQREARNLLLELEQYYRTIPPSGEIGGA